MAEQEADNKVVKRVAINGGVILVIGLACSVLGYFGIKAFKETMGKAMETMQAWTQDMEQSQEAADKFLNSIQVDDLDGAYQSTTETFKKRMPRKDLDDLGKKTPSSKEHTT